MPALSSDNPKVIAVCVQNGSWNLQRVLTYVKKGPHIWACECLILGQEWTMFGLHIHLQEFSCVCPVLRCMEIRLHYNLQWETVPAALTDADCHCRAQLPSQNRQLAQRYRLPSSAGTSAQEKTFSTSWRFLKSLWI